MAYAMKDASDLIGVSLATKMPVFHIGYANATSSEWSAESVFANKKGSRAIGWDSDRQGTLTLETELFDIGLLAMQMGSDIKEGEDNVFTVNHGELTTERKIKLVSDGVVDIDTLSVIKCRPNSNEHIGLPLTNTSTIAEKVPEQVTNITVSFNDKTTRVSFPRVSKADTYTVLRDGNVVGEVLSNSFTETGLVPETKYRYEIIAVNSYGQGAKSAVVEVTMAAEGQTSYSNATATTAAIDTAKNNTPTINPIEAGDVTYTVENGEVVFSDTAAVGDRYAVYFMELVDNVRTFTISADKFPGNYEIYANGVMRDEQGNDDVIQIHYFNARPQSNFSLTQSATEPTSLSIVFDLLPVDGILAEFKVID